jgi:hypothetical protein
VEAFMSSVSSKDEPEGEKKKESSEKGTGQNEKEELVLTPGGWRPKSKTHFIEPGYHVREENGRLKKVCTATGEVVEDLGEVPKTEPDKTDKPK